MPISTSGYVSVGVLGGMAFEPYYTTDNTLLSELNHITAKAYRAVTGKKGIYHSAAQRMECNQKEWYVTSPGGVELSHVRQSARLWSAHRYW